MRLAITLLSAFILVSTSFAQQDAKSKQVLDAVSKKTKSYPAIYAEYKMHMKSDADKIDESFTGKVWIKGDKYVLEAQGQKIYSDGESLWRYVKEDNEVEVDNVPDEDDEESISPSKLLTIYETGFKHKYMGEKNINGQATHLINLFPMNPEEKPFHTLKMEVNKAQNQITKMIQKGKDGTDITYTIQKFDGSKDIPDSKFKFNKASFPGVEVIDLR